MVEDGAYNRLLRQYYRTGKPLPAIAEVLLRVCRAFADDEKAATLKVLHEFFFLEADGWHNKRADEELARASQLSEKRRDAGKKGAEKTNSKKSAIAEVLPSQLPTQPQPQKKVFVLPPWIPREAWDQYEVMRKRIRKPMTDRARELAVGDLEKLMKDGEDVEQVLNQSILKSYTGLFPVKKDNTKSSKGLDLNDLYGAVNEQTGIHQADARAIAGGIPNAVERRR
jgi:uncharacterized protein YdaU (DUF1376 family)